MKKIEILARELPEEFLINDLFCLFDNFDSVKIFYEPQINIEARTAKERIKKCVNSTYNKMNHTIEANRLYNNFLTNLNKAEIKFV